MAVPMKSIVFWDVMPCSLVHSYQRLGGTCYLHLQGRKWKQRAAQKGW